MKTFGLDHSSFPSGMWPSLLFLLVRQAAIRTAGQMCMGFGKGSAAGEVADSCCEGYGSCLGYFTKLPFPSVSWFAIGLLEDQIRQRLG